MREKGVLMFKMPNENDSQQYITNNINIIVIYMS